MKSWCHLIPLLLLLLSTSLIAEEPETAWDPDHGSITHGSRHVFGYARVPPNFIQRMNPTPEDQADDPFEAEDSASRFNFYQRSPVVPMAKLPRCLPRRQHYLDVSKFFKLNGINIEAPGWILFSGGLGGEPAIYFCTTRANANIIEQILPHRCAQPNHITQLACLVSIPHQSLDSQAWTYEKLLTSQARTHARFGLQGRSGESISQQLITQKPDSRIHYTIEPTLSEDHQLLDCRLSFHYNNPSAKIQIHQETALVYSAGTPFALDCGTHGTPKRHFFLIISNTVTTAAPNHQSHLTTPLEQIDGIYALPRQDRPDQPAQATADPYKTHSYRTPPNFLTQLRDNLRHSRAGDDPFSDAEHQPISAPVRVQSIPNHPPLPSKHRVFDVSPQLKTLGMPLFEHEWVYYNTNTHQLIAHGSFSLQHRLRHLTENLSQTPCQVQVSAQIVTVNREGITPENWTIQKIQSQQPTAIKTYATVARSGEISRVGKPTQTHIDKKSGKATSVYTFEFEPTISEDKHNIDCRIRLQSQELSPAHLTIKLNTTITARDGKPTIIELGHPADPKRSTLLVLHTDLITPDGSYYRDRFRPIPDTPQPQATPKP